MLGIIELAIPLVALQNHGRAAKVESAGSGGALVLALFVLQSRSCTIPR